jgi:hypothetical protein
VFGFNRPWIHRGFDRFVAGPSIGAARTLSCNYRRHKIPDNLVDYWVGIIRCGDKSYLSEQGITTSGNIELTYFPGFQLMHFNLVHMGMRGRQDLKNPPTSVGGIQEECWPAFHRLDFNEPPAAAGGIR